MDKTITKRILSTVLLLSIFWLLPFTVTAQNRKLQDNNLSVNVKKESVTSVLERLSRLSGYQFLYDQKMMDQLAPVTLNVQKASLNTILTRIFANTPMTYKIVDGTITLGQKSLVDDTQDKQSFSDRVSGTITNERDEPIIGATILVKGHPTMGTTSDVNGNYALTNLPENAVLLFSYLGMAPQEISVGIRTKLNIVMMEDAVGIDEIVAIGYGSAKKGNVTGSIASLKAKDLVVAPVASTTNALAGQLPGLIAVQSSGQPGSDAAALSIRGFGGALVIVDGIESSFNNIDANQIESISILKDGSASIYGARAGSGVILVTTKRGIDNKPTITVNSSYTMQGITNMPHPVNAGQYAELAREKWINQGKPEATAPFTETQIGKYYEGTDPQYPNTDWYGLLVRNWAPQNQHNISIRGGSTKIKYYGFLGYLNQKTMWKTSGGGYDRYNLQSNIDAKILDNLSLQIDLASIIEDRKFPSRSMAAGDGAWFDFWSTLPIYPATLPDPNKVSYASTNGTGGVHVSTNRDLYGYTDTGSQNLRGTVSLNYQFKSVPGLSFKVFGNYNRDYSTQKSFEKPIKFYTYDYASDAYTLAGQKDSKASLNVSKNGAQTLTGQLSLNYDRVFNEKHHVTALALYEVIDYKTDWLFGSRKNFLTPVIDELFGGSLKDMRSDGTATVMGRVSYVGRINYSFMNKYLIETILRADASAKFPKNSRWGYFPSVSLGWRITEEKFMKNVKKLDDLKLRLSYGESGNDAVGNFQYLAGYNIGNPYIFDKDILQGVTSKGLANPFLTWEKISIYNAGVDFSLFERKLYGELDAFYRERTGIPASRLSTLPSSFGASLPDENLNSLNDRGFELRVGTYGGTKDWTWDISGNISWARSKWAHFEEPDYTDPEQRRVSRKSGQWRNIQYGYLSDGIFTSQEEIDNLGFDQDKNGNTTLRPGDIRYKNRNDDEVLDWKDQVRIGKDNTPNWMVGLSTKLAWRNIDFAALFQGAFGYNTYVDLDLEHDVATELYYKLRWSKDNNRRNADFPRVGGATTNNEMSDFFYKKAGYLRLKNMSVGYTFPKKWLQKVKIEQLRIYVAGTNLFTIDRLNKYDIDPEVPSGLAGRYYPQQRTITFGINLSI